MPTLEQGRIIWAELASSDGSTRKRRPAVVVTATAEIKADESFIVVAATTKFTEPLPDNHVRLPWQRDAKVRTRLREATVVVCNWLCEIHPADIVHFGGVVPPETMKEILDAIDRETKE